MINQDIITIDYGLETIIRKMEEDPQLLNEENYIKVNLPTTLAKFKSGNGEGIWAIPYEMNDQRISDKNILGTKFNVVVLNNCLSYPFRVGDIIQVKIINEEQRPIIDKEWLDQNEKLRMFYD